MNIKLFEDVKEAAHFQNYDDFSVFSEGVMKLAEKQNEETFQNLIGLFNDETRYPEVMFNLVHALESYPDELYVTLVLKFLDNISNSYKGWYARLVIRILNEDKCKQIFLRKLKGLDLNSTNQLTEIIKSYYPEKLELLNKK
jgi:hypothetical protein